MAEFKCVVSGLASSTDDRKLLDTFGRFGQILDCTIVPGILRSGLLTFSDGQAMLDAIMAMNSKELDGNIITVDRTHFGKELKPEPVSWTGLEKQAAMEVLQGDPIPSNSSAIKERLELTEMMGEVRSSAALLVAERGKNTYSKKRKSCKKKKEKSSETLMLEEESSNESSLLSNSHSLVAERGISLSGRGGRGGGSGGVHGH